jgi:hypothetical protein
MIMVDCFRALPGQIHTLHPCERCGSAIDGDGLLCKRCIKKNRQDKRRASRRRQIQGVLAIASGRTSFNKRDTMEPPVTRASVKNTERMIGRLTPECELAAERPDPGYLTPKAKDRI